MRCCYRLGLFLSAAAGMVCLLAWPGPRVQALVQPEPASPKVAVFEAEDLLEQRRESGRAYLPFLRVPTLHTGIYSLAAGAEDRQSPHNQDELYYVLEGKAQLRTNTGEGDEDQAVQAGSVIFIAAGVEHRFHSIEEDLELLVFFSTAPTE